MKNPFSSRFSGAGGFKCPVKKVYIPYILNAYAVLFVNCISVCKKGNQNQKKHKTPCVSKSKEVLRRDLDIKKNTPNCCV